MMIHALRDLPCHGKNAITRPNGQPAPGDPSRRRAVRPRIESLEDRLVLAGSVFPQATLDSAAVYMLSLINKARANPSATAASFGISLNQGVPAGSPQISPAPKQPLAMNPQLINSIAGHLKVWLSEYANNPYQADIHNGLGDGTVTCANHRRRIPLYLVR